MTQKRQFEVEPTTSALPEDFDYSKIPVCSGCGHINWGWNTGNQCCIGAGVMSLREYVEEVQHEKFDASKWKLYDLDIL